MTKKADIHIEIELDENHVPETIHWSAPDGGIEDEEARALFLYAWNEPAKETLKLDLWTKKMPIDSMKMFFHLVLTSMAETYERAADDEVLANEIAEFAKKFG